MGLPKQVQKQIEAAQILEQQLTAVAQPQESPPQPVEAPAQQPEPQEAKPVEQPKQQQESDANWEQKYKSLAGHYRRFAEEQNAKVAELSARLEELSKRPVQVEKPAEPTDKQLVTEADVEQFGSDLVSLARRVAKEEFGERESAYKQMIDKLQTALEAANARIGKVDESLAKNSQETFFTKLESRLPDWESIQNTPECQDWLATRVPGTRATWHDALVAAAQDEDVDRTIEVFETFMQVTGKGRKSPEPKVNQELQRQVAPAKSKGSSQSPQPEKRVYTMADIEATSQRIIKLNKAGQYEEAARLESDLNAAYAEGRYRA